VEIDVAPFLGTYERAGVRMQLRQDDGRLLLEITPTGPLAEMSPAEPPKQLLVLDDSTLITAEVEPRLGHHLTLKFIEPSNNGFGYVHFGARATPRVAG
jgi:hypothetical protein